MSDVDHSPSFLYLFAEGTDGGLILLGKLESCLDLGRIVDDLAVELATLLDQPLLLLVRFLECPVQLFVLKPFVPSKRDRIFRLYISLHTLAADLQSIIQY